MTAPLPILDSGAQPCFNGVMSTPRRISAVVMNGEEEVMPDRIAYGVVTRSIDGIVRVVAFGDVENHDTADRNLYYVQLQPQLEAWLDAHNGRGVWPAEGGYLIELQIEED